MTANIQPTNSTVAIRRIHGLRFVGFVTIVFILPPVVVALIWQRLVERPKFEFTGAARLYRAASGGMMA
jgi:hypothetical protein